MIHLYQAPKTADAPIFLFLHGTGGTEQDLVGLVSLLDSEAGYLSVRGEVSENGMPRFFKRLAEGVFDEEDLALRTARLIQFLRDQAAERGFDLDRLIPVGYSNGANIAANMLFEEALFKQAILLHPMVPRRGVTLPDLSDVRVFIGAGSNDPICPAQETEELSALLKQAGASVDVTWSNYGHQLVMPTIEAATDWLNH
ncbi:MULTISPECIES: alpha/beta hydrolase [Exiguobacterium]|uniref:Alpha/beta hydrolase n=1 Tax=Exiguobacterium acetylicum TaxID=41170 RepID=A0ABX8G8V6_EXIAC|nr:MULTISPECIES: alpha/beta hydrolase [Exiguobacterium]QWB29607.1 alpha/beta hydrolase [Exiguobacterium acetylicum]HBQ77361.1 carboxylesterase [Exiguobacterium sp.]HCD57966.1 carboxylesterase [Exiguobacterium sp.]